MDEARFERAFENFVSCRSGVDRTNSVQEFFASNFFDFLPEFVCPAHQRYIRGVFVVGQSDYPVDSVRRPFCVRDIKFFEPKHFLAAFGSEVVDSRTAHGTNTQDDAIVVVTQCGTPGTRSNRKIDPKLRLHPRFAGELSTAKRARAHVLASGQ